MQSVYEKELIDNYMAKVKLAIRNKRLTRKRDIYREAKRIAKKEDKALLTNFSEVFR